MIMCRVLRMLHGHVQIYSTLNEVLDDVGDIRPLTCSKESYGQSQTGVAAYFLTHSYAD